MRRYRQGMITVKTGQGAPEDHAKDAVPRIFFKTIGKMQKIKKSFRSSPIAAFGVAKRPQSLKLSA